MTWLKRKWFKLSPRTRDTLTRAGKTFIEVFLAAAVPAIVALPAVTVAALVTIVVAAGASAISVVWNTVLQPALPTTTVVEVFVPVFPEDDKLPGE